MRNHTCFENSACTVAIISLKRTTISPANTALISLILKHDHSCQTRQRFKKKKNSLLFAANLRYVAQHNSHYSVRVNTCGQRYNVNPLGIFIGVYEYRTKNPRYFNNTDGVLLTTGLNRLKDTNISQNRFKKLHIAPAIPDISAIKDAGVFLQSEPPPPALHHSSTI